MKYLYLFVFILCLFFVKPASAQYQSSSATTGQTLSFGFEGAFALSPQFDGAHPYAPYRVGAGFLSRFEYPISDNELNFTLSAGANIFLSDQTVRSIFKRANSFTEKTYIFIPVKFGGKYYFNDNIYATAEGGIVSNVSNGFKFTPVYAPGVGVTFAYADVRAIDIGLKYETWNQVDEFGETFIKGFLTLGVTYKFGIGEGK
jgi:hypothetical protein